MLSQYNSRGFKMVNLVFELNLFSVETSANWCWTCAMLLIISYVEKIVLLVNGTEWHCRQLILKPLLTNIVVQGFWEVCSKQYTYKFIQINNFCYPLAGFPSKWVIFLSLMFNAEFQHSDGHILLTSFSISTSLISSECVDTTLQYL